MPQLKCGTMPASLIKASMRPKRSATAKTKRRMSFSSRTSVGTAMASRFSFWISPRVLCMRSASASAMTTLAPACASVSAAWRPMPLAPPVTTATFPCIMIPPVTCGCACLFQYLTASKLQQLVGVMKYWSDEVLSRRLFGFEPDNAVAAVAKGLGLRGAAATKVDWFHGARRVLLACVVDHFGAAGNFVGTVFQGFYDHAAIGFPPRDWAIKTISHRVGAFNGFLPR